MSTTSSASPTESARSASCSGLLPRVPVATGSGASGVNGSSRRALKALLREAVAYNTTHAVPKSRGSRA